MSTAPLKIDVDSFWMPTASSTLAEQTDQAYYICYYICIGFFILVVGAMILFAIKYKRKSDDELTTPIDHSFKLELFWSIVPAVLLVWLFVIGIRGYANASVAPNDSFEIKVTGQMWNWSFEYPDGTVTQELYVPVGRPVRMLMSSKDVIHSMFIPEFRVKQDVVPGMYSTLWFTSIREFDSSTIECAEYCGDGHSKMLTEVHSMSAAKFDEFYANGFEDPNHPLPPEQRGEKKYNALCTACHTTDGSRLVGPSFQNVWGRQEKFEDGSSGVVDENYVRQSILEPQAKIVDGYPHSMPSFAGQLKDKDIEGIIAFLKTQKK